MHCHNMSAGGWQTSCQHIIQFLVRRLLKPGCFYYRLQLTAKEQVRRAAPQHLRLLADVLALPLQAQYTALAALLRALAAAAAPAAASLATLLLASTAARAPWHAIPFGLPLLAGAVNLASWALSLVLQRRLETVLRPVVHQLTAQSRASLPCACWVCY